jgi:hypothetical protein
VVGVVDTNCDPDDITYVIPSNDDAIRAIKLITGKIADAAIEGRRTYQEQYAASQVAQAAAQAEEKAEAVERIKVTVEDMSDEAPTAGLLPTQTDATAAPVRKPAPKSARPSADAARKPGARTSRPPARGDKPAPRKVAAPKAKKDTAPKDKIE